MSLQRLLKKLECFLKLEKKYTTSQDLPSKSKVKRNISRMKIKKSRRTFDSKKDIPVVWPLSTWPVLWEQRLPTHKPTRLLGWTG